MCVGDWRIGRLIRRQVSSGTLTTGNGLSVLTNPQRVGIIFGMEGATGPPAARAQVAMDSVIFTEINTNTPPLRITLKEHGELPTRAWSITATGATFNLMIIELILPEDVIAASLQSFYSDYQQWIKSH